MIEGIYFDEQTRQFTAFSDEDRQQAKKYRRDATIGGALGGYAVGGTAGAGIGAATTIGLKNRLMKKGLSEEEAKKEASRIRNKRTLIGAGVGAVIGSTASGYGMNRIVRKAHKDAGIL